MSSSRLVCLSAILLLVCPSLATSMTTFGQLPVADQAVPQAHQAVTLSEMPAVDLSNSTLSPIVDPKLTTTSVPSVLSLVQANLSTPAPLALPPVIPNFVNSYFLQPLVNLNATVAQAANTVPQQMAINGQTLGNALMLSLQQSANAASQAAARVNETLLSLHNATNSLIEAQRPRIMAPIVLFGQANSALNRLALSLLNSTTTSLGSGINTVGQSISNAGVNVQTLGGSLLSWADTLEKMRQQVNASMPVAVTPMPILFGIPVAQTQAPVAQVPVTETPAPVSQTLTPIAQVPVASAAQTQALAAQTFGLVAPVLVAPVAQTLDSVTSTKAPAAAVSTLVPIPTL